MRLFYQTRLKWHRRLLKKQLQRLQGPPRKRVNLQKAHAIGILFDATDLENRQTVLQYADKLKKQGKRVRLLGYFDDDTKNENFTFRHFNRHQFDFFLRPKAQTVQEFMDQNFDILMTLDPEPQLFAEYISTLSKAPLRVGPSTENIYAFDLMIETKGNNLSQYIEQMELLLSKTNTTHEAA